MACGLLQIWNCAVTRCTRPIHIQWHGGWWDQHWNMKPLITHSERRPQNIYSQEEIKLRLFSPILSSNWQHKFFIFITNQWNLIICVDKMQYEHLAILFNLKNCQFAHRIVIFNLCLCCQFEDLQIILPKIIPISHHNIELWQMRDHSLQNFSLFGTYSTSQKKRLN